MVKVVAKQTIDKLKIYPYIRLNTLQQHFEVIMTTQSIIKSQAIALSWYWLGKVKEQTDTTYADYVQSLVGQTIISEVSIGGRAWMRHEETLTGRRANAIIRRGENAWLLCDSTGNKTGLPLCYEVLQDNAGYVVVHRETSRHCIHTPSGGTGGYPDGKTPCDRVVARGKNSRDAIENAKECVNV